MVSEDFFNYKSLPAVIFKHTIEVETSCYPSRHESFHYQLSQIVLFSTPAQNLNIHHQHNQNTCNVMGNVENGAGGTRWELFKVAEEASCYHCNITLLFLKGHCESL